MMNLYKFIIHHSKCVLLTLHKVIQHMKYLVLLACMSAFALQAQTTFVKKYHNGMPDTIWHINGRDTFLWASFFTT
jgi:hypothetical protein